MKKIIFIISLIALSFLSNAQESKNILFIHGNRLVMYMPFSAWYDSGFTRGLLLPFFR
jgi:hypothetical protein